MNCLVGEQQYFEMSALLYRRGIRLVFDLASDVLSFFLDLFTHFVE